MTLARHLTRPMLASIFVTGGIDTLRNPAARVEMAGDLATEVADALPLDLPDDPESLVKLDAAAKVVGGLMLASGGKLARPGALICAASLVPTTFAAHRFWEETDPKAKAQQQIHFMKNLSLLGGLLIAALDTGGRPSVPWRAKRRAQLLSEQASGLTDRIGHSAPTLADRAGDRVSDLAGHVGVLADRAGHVAADLAGQVKPVASELAGQVRPFAADLADRAGDLLPR